MKNQLFNYAIKDGQYVSIDVFTPGIGARCGCICPECGEQVRSNVTAKTRDQLKIDFTNHFSHVDENSSCGGGYEETLLHLKAKEIIASHTELFVPGKLTGKQLIRYSSVRIEPAFPNVNFKKYRPDIIVRTIADTDLAIEIVVTSPVSSQKQSLYKDSGVACLVVDLSRWKGKLISRIESQLKHEILISISNKRWIWNETLDDEPIEVMTKEREPSIWDNPITWFFAFLGGWFILTRIKNWLFGKPRN